MKPMALKKSKKGTNLPSEAHAELVASLEENHILTLIMKHSRNIAYGIGALLLLMLVIYRYNSHNQTQAQQSYIESDIDFFQLQRQIGNQEAFDDYLTKLNGILMAHPELHAKYDGAIAQTLLLNNEAKKAEVFATPALNRTKDEESPYFVDYSQTTLLIANGQYQKALTNAINLKQKLNSVYSKSELNNKDVSTNLLYAMNLIRIATLQQQAGNKKEELTALQELEDIVKNQTNAADSLAFNELLALFTEGKVTLLDYIDSRKR